MNVIESIAPIGEELDVLRSTVGEADFVDWMVREIDNTNSQIMEAEKGLRQLAVGETENLHHVMLELEKATTSFQLLTQVRNKLLEGYQEIMRMQV